MQVAICDDEKVFRNQIKEILIKYKRENRIQIDIYEFGSGKDLLLSDKIFDLVFLDYQMDELDGIKTAETLRSKNSICSIVFITSYPEQCIIDAFTVQTFRFIIKPIDEKLIIEALDSYIHQQKILQPLVIISDGELRTIHSKDIIYLEGDGKYCWVRTTTETVHSSKTLSQVYELLPPHCFFRIHKSYVVNLYCISSIQNNTLSLTNGEKATIGRSKQKEFKKIYKQFIQNYFVRL